MRVASIAGLLGGVFLLPPIQAGAATDAAHGLFSQMRHAARTLDYRGIFVYQNGASLSTLKVEHAWHDGKEYERLVSQDGARREVLVDGDLVTYVRPSTKSVVIMHRDSHSSLPGRFASDAHATPYYHLELGATKRIAGQTCRVLVLKPIDRYRYQHRMCVDVGNHLPLESEVIDRQGNPVERLLFTDIKLVTGLKPAAFKPPVLGPQYTLRWVKTRQAGDEAKHDGSRWSFKPSALPPGFVLRAAQTRRFSASGDPVRHFVLGDGVATVSVFIATHEHAVHAASSMERSGALNVLTTSSHGALVTVMGEVPRITVRRIAGALTYSKTR
ncbi:MucB/RseB C-terminal domain-containing protein [Acidihalobacter prosperus]|uniref:Sigma factor RpoE negative regulatory protein RseB n=1 Tax=Acidihalobacter prosperus TaxID=160660 RepID=A0A1A6C774_9GAMM|nr:MucB/RseB C-terminal domain-containing protein [Acidihalobacter prosperus]OBS10400.1 Sigma factor RpoE negative regulatory protein RseB [Acidihalobacter prosperus]